MLNPIFQIIKIFASNNVPPNKLLIPIIFVKSVKIHVWSVKELLLIVQLVLLVLSYI